MDKKFKRLGLTPSTRLHFNDRPTYLESICATFCDSLLQAASCEPPAQAEVIHEVIINNAHYQLIRKPLPTHQQLSGREVEIARYIIQGQPNKVIAQRLAISPWTVATYVRRIFTKLDVRSRAELVAYVMQNNLFS